MKYSLVPLACALLATMSAAAQGSSADESIVIADYTPEMIVVSASRVTVSTYQVGSAVTVISGETLQTHQMQTVFDALRDVPGVEVSRTGTVGSISQIRIRGAEAGQALVLIDGVRANDPAQSSEEFNFAHLLSAGIERIEVLRGPQSALWGADALAGVINVVTVAPESGLHARASAEYGSFDSKQVSGLINIGGENYAAVFDGEWLDIGGLNIARTGHEDDGYRNTSVGVRARAQLAPRLGLLLSLHHVAARSDSETTDFFGAFSIPLDSGDFTRFGATYGRAQAEWELTDNFDVIAGASLMRSEAKDYTSAFGAPFDVSFNDRTQGGDTRFDLQSNVRWRGWGADQRVSVLAETHRETFDMVRLDLPDANQIQHEANSAVAGEYWIGVSDAAFISLGARHDWNGRFDDSTTWRATVSAFVPKTGLRLHASAGTGVKNPDFFELFGFFPAPAFVGNPNLKPEKSFGWDAGVQVDVADGVGFDVTYFHADLEDEIFTDSSVFPNTARNASGDSKRQGLEVSANVYLGRGVNVVGAYTYLDAKESDDAAEIRRPHHIASVNLDWKPADDRTHLNLGIDYHGSQRDTVFLNVFLPPFSMPVTLDAYTLVRVAGSYDITDNFAVFARVENALDAHYEEVFGYRTRGFGVFGGIRAKFD